MAEAEEAKGRSEALDRGSSNQFPWPAGAEKFGSPDGERSVAPARGSAAAGISRRFEGESLGAVRFGAEHDAAVAVQQAVRRCDCRRCGVGTRHAHSQHGVAHRRPGSAGTQIDALGQRHLPQAVGRQRPGASGGRRGVLRQPAAVAPADVAQPRLAGSSSWEIDKVAAISLARARCCSTPRSTLSRSRQGLGRLMLGWPLCDQQRHGQAQAGIVRGMLKAQGLAQRSLMPGNILLWSCC